MTASATSYASYAGTRIVLPSDQFRTLDEVLRLARERGSSGVVVFDLDSTVFDNRPRQARIVREYGREAGLPLLERAEPRHWTSWSLEDAFRAVGLDEESIKKHAAPAKNFWRDRFFTSPYCEDDIPIEGAAQFLADVVATGVHLVYATGRHTEMGPGTVVAMRSGGFPIPNGDKVQLLLKPTLAMEDDAWKAAVCKRLDELGEVVAAFDNEPKHINTYATRYPGALCVHLATDDSGRPIPLAPSIVSVANFKRG